MATLIGSLGALISGAIAQYNKKVWLSGYGGEWQKAQVLYCTVQMSKDTSTQVTKSLVSTAMELKARGHQQQQRSAMYGKPHHSTNEQRSRRKVHRQSRTTTGLRSGSDR